ncbi:Crp/Fnr family transcriptional regulator [Arthrobacter sp. NPDC056886]|uniref:Crp/Fnr family transcriptional regulator n=1 Tax=Arthrobacter sp. NPDC056886 TaxID=3345960 RepID=UPI00366CC2B0
MVLIVGGLVEAPTFAVSLTIRRLWSYAVVQDVAVGDTVFRAGDETYDLIVIERGAVDLIRAATHDAPEEVVVSHGPGRFIGELSLLTGQAVYLTGLVVQAGRIHRIPPAQFRRLMAEDAELSTPSGPSRLCRWGNRDSS